MTALETGRAGLAKDHVARDIYLGHKDLGHVVTGQECRVDVHRIRGRTEDPHPVDQGALCSFVCLCLPMFLFVLLCFFCVPHSSLFFYVSLCLLRFFCNFFCVFMYLYILVLLAFNQFLSLNFIFSYN